MHHNCFLNTINKNPQTPMIFSINVNTSVMFLLYVLKFDYLNYFKLKKYSMFFM